MDIIGDRRFVEIPGEKQHELPPLLVHSSPHMKRLDKVMDMANRIVESDDMIAPELLDEVAAALDVDRRKMDLALTLVEQYKGLAMHWQWGDDVLEWIRQCETTFDTNRDLRNVLRPDVWPHAGRSSFVTLLTDKSVETNGIELDKAVGLRLAFRQLPPIGLFSDQFLFYLKSALAATAYQTWTHMVPDPVSSLPPERFHFQIYSM
jgi:hypothetical protein